MTTILFECPNCRRANALTWWQGKSGKRKLGVFCDHQGGTRRHLSGFVYAERTEFIELEIPPENMPTPDDLADLPVYFTPEAKKAAALKGQDQLVMMNVAPGQAVERTVELPRTVREAQPYAQSAAGERWVEEQCQRDDQEAERIKAAILERQQAQKELDDQIAGLVRRRTALEGDERELRKQLRAVWTEPLELR